MDDLSEKISALLSDPSALQSIRNMASSLIDGEEKEKPKGIDSVAAPNIDMGKIMMLMNKINSSENDERTRLLLALRPHLSEKRREKVDKAVKILKLIDLLPLLRESGFINIF